MNVLTTEVTPFAITAEGECSFAAWVCSDCGHIHGGAPYGFCKCFCTYPGIKFVTGFTSLKGLGE